MTLSDDQISLPGGSLFVVATPIGHLGDLSPRAREILTGADLICAEDTRTTGVLLGRFGIKTPTRSLHEHNETRLAATLVDLLREGQCIALVSDAGTPLVSDPGYAFVAAVRDAGLPVYAVPGPSAVLAALSISGLPTDRFVFEGFLPSRGGARRARLQELSSEGRTWVAFESSHRITDCAEDLAKCLPGRRLCIARELTKRFEESQRLIVDELPAWLSENTHRIRGEFVLVIEGAPQAEASSADARRVLEELVKELPPSTAARVASRLTGVPRQQLYGMAVGITGESD